MSIGPGPGKYKARAIPNSEQFGTSKNGNEQVAFDLRITQGDHEGEVVTTILSFAGQARDISIERLKACGWSLGDSFDGIDGHEVTIEGKEDTYDGKTTLKWEIKTGAGKFEFKEALPEARAKSFMGELSKYAKALETEGPSSPNAKPAPYPKDWDKGAGTPRVQL